jgi:hypothetical protein
LEELIYWGIIFLFYLFSAYRSRQKKVQSEDFQVPEVKPDSAPKTSTPDFNIFEFLDNAVEKSAVEMDNFVNEKPSSLVNEKLSIPNIEDELIESNHEKNQHSGRAINLRDQHLDHLQSRIQTKKHAIHSKQKLLTLQEKLKNKPAKLAIVMKAIFDPPKSQGI